MINRQALLADLQKFLQRIEADLLERSESTEVPEVPAALHAEYEKASKAERTAQNYEDWRTDTITQAAAAWVLSCVFVRFLEDNSLIDPPKIAGPGERLSRARDEHELYFRSHPQYTDREYLLSIFGELAKLPGTKDIFGEHNAINDLPNWLSGDAAGELLNFFQKIDASTGNLVHDFTDSNWDTRFLGDLYQDLSEAARKKFALLQTPDFVEEFILDRTLEPALNEFGLVPSSQPSEVSCRQDRKAESYSLNADCFRMIDPACGSGHFLLGAFPRLLDRWQRKEPGTNIRELTQRALNSIHGVDINPFAVAIAKFRLLLVAMKACDIQRLADAPAFHVNVACGDSLLHGENRTSSGQRLWDYAEGATDEELYSHAYPGEDLQTVRSLLKPGTYHCIVANPPYIVPKDRKQNQWYRRRFSACHMKYSLSVPFMQQIFQLAVSGGFTGQITANSFMKREFGRKLIELFFPTVDLTHVIDSKAAFIPGHATPTAILFGRNRPPKNAALRTVLSKRGEPSTPENPREGIVWSDILRGIDQPGFESAFISVNDSDRILFHQHPWSIGGGGAAELKAYLDENSTQQLESIIESVGVLGMTNAEDTFILPTHTFLRFGCESIAFRKIIGGDGVRDWRLFGSDSVAFPYRQGELIGLSELPNLSKFLWNSRTVLGNRATFGGATYFQEGRPWWAWHQLTTQRLKPLLTVAIANIASHIHAAISENKICFNVTALTLQLPLGSPDDDHYFVLGYINSSLACFWMKQVSHEKQMMGGESIRIDSRAKVPYSFSSTQFGKLPLPIGFGEGVFKDRLTGLARRMVELTGELERCAPESILSKAHTLAEMRSLWQESQLKSRKIRSQMILLQEEIDFTVYFGWGLVSNDALLNDIEQVDSQLEVGARPFEILAGSNVDGFSVSKETPDSLIDIAQALWAKRINMLKTSTELQLIEDSHYKRRWIGQQGKYNSKKDNESLGNALLDWILVRLESFFDIDGRMSEKDDLSTRSSSDSLPMADVSLFTVAQIADAARRDPQFMEVGELYRDDPAFDVQALVEELVLAESVPHLPILRYKDSGLRKRAEWEKTWDLQRREDAGESVGTIPVPPKYTSADFISTGGARYWALRGKLDVPKERWISFPHCEGPDGTLVICWAGYDHLQQAQAISAYFVRVQTEFGGSDDPRLIPLLASLIELLPWLKQWHNEPNANFDGLRMGDYFEGFVNEEARNLGKTLAEIKAWVPPKKVAKKKAASKSATKKTSKKKAAEEASQVEADD